jgi:hypothetical protein
MVAGSIISAAFVDGFTREPVGGTETADARPKLFFLAFEPRWIAFGRREFGHVLLNQSGYGRASLRGPKAGAAVGLVVH